MFMMIISQDSCKDSQFADELALAYISNSTIFPVSLEKYRDISPMTYLDFCTVVLAHWNNSPRIDISLHIIQISIQPALQQSFSLKSSALDHSDTSAIYILFLAMDIVDIIIFIILH
jgi:hypothetical protein